MSDEVIYSTTRQDANNSVRHAEYDGITFSAFPHQSFTARVGNISVSILSSGNQYAVSAYRCHADGSSNGVLYSRQSTLDDAVIYGAKILKEAGRS